MPKRPLKIVSVSSEVAPFSKTGGLGEVAGFLPQFLEAGGNEVIVITPLYGQLIDVKENKLEIFYENVEIRINDKHSVTVNYWKGFLKDGLPIYFVENKKYFSARKSLYGSSHENERFMVFDVAALHLLTLLDFRADIIHCHDWQTGLIPYYLKTLYQQNDTLKKTKTLFTIHNLVFQFGYNWWGVPGKKRDNGKKPMPGLEDPELETINFTKRAILHADAVNTVSEQYRQEMMTKNFGQGLHRILLNRKEKLFGIVNGIDNDAYNPKSDPGLAQNYTFRDPEKKRANKESLQKFFSLPTDPDVPLIGLTSRVTYQKGYELIVQLLEPLLKLDVQIIIMGDGKKEYVDQIKKQAKKHPKKLVWSPFLSDKETLTYAGADIFLLPSHHEPCGINQMIAMRYGCVPVVRHVGGLYDTVRSYNPKKKKGTGFIFTGFDPFSLYAAIIRALETFQYKSIWKELVVRAMQESNGWEIPAKKYELLFKKIIKGEI